MNEETIAQPTKSRMKKSRRVILAAVCVLLIATVLVSFIVLNNSHKTSPSSNSDFSPSKGGSSQPSSPPTKSGVTMVDLQMDYDAWKGDFKSYNENDTVVLRDTITGIELAKNRFGHPLTMLYFRAHPLPSLDDLLSGRVQNESWYTWSRGNWEHAAMTNSIFPVKYDSDSRKYLPEVGLSFQGDVRNRFRVGSTVEITLHIVKGTTWDVRSYGTMVVESIYEFKWAIKP